MSIWVSWSIISLLYIIFLCRVFSKLLTVSIKRKKSTTIFVILIFSIIDGLIAYKNLDIRPFLINVNYVLILYYLYPTNISKSVISVFLFSIISAIAEILFILFLLFIGVNVQLFTTTFIGIIVSNISILCLLALFYKIKLIINIIKKIMIWFTYKKMINLLIIDITVFFTISNLMKENFLNVSYISNVISIYMFVLCLIALLIELFRENSEKNKVINDYDQLMNYAKTYEQEVGEKSKWQHEYENQLVMIRNRINPDNIKAIKYVNELLKNKPISENYQWLGKLSKFPDIGIKGFLHYKICQMQAQGITVFVDVVNDDNKIISLTEEDSKFLEENLQDISHVLGVYLDNAIDAASVSEKKYLILEVQYNRENITFQISNTFKGDISKIDCERFTTKGQGHGYGLSIVKSIMERNKNLSQSREINGIYYVQTFTINMNI